MFATATAADADELTSIALSDTDGRQTTACVVLGWLHFFRCACLATAARQAQMARALTFLAPVADNPAVLLDPLRSLIGPTANATAQEQVGTDMLRAVLETPDPYLVGAGITLMAAAVAATADDDPRAGNRIAMVIMGHQWRYQRTHRADDLERTIETGERAIRILRADHPDFAGILSNLGVAHQARYKRTGGIPDLTRSIELTETALAAHSADDPQRAVCLSNLADGYRHRSTRTGDLTDLGAAIDCAEQALVCTPAGQPEHADYLAKVGSVYFRRYERLGDVADLRRAIECAEQARTAAPEEHKPPTDLCVMYRERYQRFGDMADLHRAVESGELALAMVPEGDVRRAVPADMLNLACRHLYEASQDLAQLRRAIDYGRLAVATYPAGSLDDLFQGVSGRRRSAIV